MAKLLLSRELPQDSPLHHSLGGLVFFNLLCGPEEITTDRDWKHVLKRFRNTLLREAGTTVNGAIISRATLQRHLHDNGMEERTAEALLNPADKQDVVLTWKLLAGVASLSPLENGSNLTYRHTRTALVLLGKLFRSLLEVYTSVNLSLREQLVRLSYVAHTILFLYRKERNAFIPVQLYHDLQTMIKNVFFSVAKAQRDNPSGEFFIILLGTDALEDEFGNVRTCVGNDSNADLLQLSNRIIGATETAQILATNPKWASAPRRKNLPALLFDSGGITAAHDHISPRYWKGNVGVRGVSLRNCWERGRVMAEEQLDGTGLDASLLFRNLEDDPMGTYDMLRPFGRLVQFEGQSSNDELEIELEVSASDPEIEQQDGAVDCVDSELTSELNAEELADTLLAEVESGEAEAKLQGAGTCYLEVDDKKFHKASLCREASRHFHIPLSTDRLKRVHSQHRYNSRSENSELVVDSSSDAQSYLQVDDPAVSLVYCDGSLFLAILKICSFKWNDSKPTMIPSGVLNSECEGLSATAQVMCLHPRAPSEGDRSDWFWNNRFEGCSSTYRIDGKLLMPIDAVLATAVTTSIDGAITNTSAEWRFDTRELLHYSSLLNERASAVHIDIPHLTRSNSFPYRHLGMLHCLMYLLSETDKDLRKRLLYLPTRD